MIRINLLGVERQKTRKAAAASFDFSRSRTVASALILILSIAGIGWWYWTLDQESVRVDAEIASAQQEAARLRSLLTEVQQFEARRAQLQQRVSLIERLRSGQSIPVQLLDHISRSLPDMLWLTELNQDANSVTITGRSTTLIALSDFVGNLGTNAVLQKPIEIVKSEVEPATSAPGQPGVELIQFTVRAQLAGAPGGPAGAKAPGAK
jgi:type IV pilus assembly protein PilN